MAFGTREVEIVDFLVLAGGVEAAHFVSGETVDVYVRLAGGQDLPSLHFGFALFTIDGGYVYGSNSVMRPRAFAVTRRGDLAVVHFAIDFAVREGNYFVDLAVFQISPNGTHYVHMRRRVVHLSVLATPEFDGLVDLMPRE